MGTWNSRGLRGSTLEDMINHSNEVYREKKLALIQKDGKYEVNKKWVGKDAGLFLQAIGVSGHENTRLLICDVPKCHPYVMVEQLMPVLPIVRCRTFDECIQCSVEAEQGAIEAFFKEK